MKKQIFFVGTTILCLSMIIFTSQGSSQELNGCWESELDTSKRICFSDTEIDYASLKPKIKNKKIDGDNVIITYSVLNTTNTAKIQFLEKDRIHLTLPQYKGIFKRKINKTN